MDSYETSISRLGGLPVFCLTVTSSPAPVTASQGGETANPSTRKVVVNRAAQGVQKEGLKAVRNQVEANARPRPGWLPHPTRARPMTTNRADDPLRDQPQGLGPWPTLA